jgi:hypothetical protein
MSEGRAWIREFKLAAACNQKVAGDRLVNSQAVSILRAECVWLERNSRKALSYHGLGSFQRINPDQYRNVLGHFWNRAKSPQQVCRAADSGNMRGLYATAGAGRSPANGSTAAVHTRERGGVEYRRRLVGHLISADLGEYMIASSGAAKRSQSQCRLPRNINRSLRRRKGRNRLQAARQIFWVPTKSPTLMRGLQAANFSKLSMEFGSSGRTRSQKPSRNILKTRK